MDITRRLRNHAMPDPQDEREVMHAPLLREAADEIESLQKQLAAAKEDAARYRYLRNPNTTLVVSGMVVDGLNLTTLPLFEQQLDDAIDSKLDRLELKL